MPIIANFYNVHTEGKTGGRTGARVGLAQWERWRVFGYSLAVMYRKSMSIALAGRRRRVSPDAEESS